MEIADTFPVPAPAGRVWDLLWDFPRLAGCLPGCEAIQRVSDQIYRARLKQSIGPFSVQADMTFTIQETQPEQRIAFEGSGGDGQGNRIKIGNASVSLQSLSPNETQVSYSAEVVMTGRLATLGYPMVRRKTRDLGVEFSRRLAQELSTDNQGGT